MAVPSIADIVYWTSIPGYWESYIYMYGGVSKAAEALHLPPKLVSKLAHAQRGYKPSDKEIYKLREALSHVGDRKQKVAQKFATKVSPVMTPNQLRNALRSARRSIKGRRYFMEQVEKYRKNRPPRYRYLPGELPPDKERKSPKKKAAHKKLKMTRRAEMRKREKKNGKRGGRRSASVRWRGR